MGWGYRGLHIDKGSDCEYSLVGGGMIQVRLLIDIDHIISISAQAMRSPLGIFASDAQSHSDMAVGRGMTQQVHQMDIGILDGMRQSRCTILFRVTLHLDNTAVIAWCDQVSQCLKQRCLVDLADQITILHHSQLPAGSLQEERQHFEQG